MSIKMSISGVSPATTIKVKRTKWPSPDMIIAIARYYWGSCRNYTTPKLDLLFSEISQDGFYPIDHDECRIQDETDNDGQVFQI